MKKLFKQIVASVLLVSFLLQSCYNPTAPSLPGDVATAANTKDDSPTPIDKTVQLPLPPSDDYSPSTVAKKEAFSLGDNQIEKRYINEKKRGYYHHEDKVASDEPSALTGYVNGQGLNRTATSNDSVKATLETTQLPEPFDIQGQHGQYRIAPYVSPAQAKAIEKQSGIVLKTEDEKFSSFLGGGAYGKVYVAEILGKNQFCAVKIITRNLHKSAHESDVQLQLTKGVKASQSQLMPLLDIVKVYQEEKLICLYYILPLAALGSVAELQEQLPSLENVELKRLLSGHIAKGLLLGLWQMHQQKIYHLDVKLANLLIDLEGKVLVADFGTSEPIQGEKPLLQPQEDSKGRFIGDGDSTYFPPERSFEPKEFDAAKADIYAAGAALWELVTGEKFGYSINPLQHRTLQNPAPNSLADLVKHLLVEDHQGRWTLEQALNHPIFQAPDLHDTETMAVVLDFLQRFVKQVQLRARDKKVELSLNELAPVQAIVTSSVLENKLKAIKNPFANRLDIQEQLKLYLPLQGSLAREVKDPAKDCFSMIEKASEFLAGDKAVLVLLADGGSGKSLFTQHLTTQLLSSHPIGSNQKPWLPLYIALGGIKHPENLLQEGLGLSHEELKALEKKYRLLLIADGYDEQSHWTNLYLQNQLHRYDMKVMITSRVNALPPHYSSYFVPQVPGERLPRGYQEMYVQPFDAKQIDAYIGNYVAHQQGRLQREVSENRLAQEWLAVATYQTQIDNTPGLKELIQTPLLCRLSLEALPELSKAASKDKPSPRKVTRAQVYEAFMTRWIEQQRNRQIQPPTLEQVFTLGERTALSLYQDNRAAQANVGVGKFQFNLTKGNFEQQANKLDWFIEAKVERECLPIQEVQKGQYKLMHFSMQEYLLARHLYQQLKQGKLKDLDWNQLKLTTEEKDRTTLYFLADFAGTDTAFENKLFALIEQTKTDKSQARAASNAITVLNAARVNLCSRDFVNVSIPDADLSGGVLCGTNLKGADLTNVNLKGTYLRDVDLRKAQLRQVRLGQLPSLELKDYVHCCVHSPDGRYLAVAAGKDIILYDAVTRQKLQTLEGHSDDVNSVSYSLHGKQLASGSGGWNRKDKTVKIWDLNTGKCVQTLEGHSDRVKSVSYSPDGKQLASAEDYDRTIKIWDIGTGKCIQTLEGHSGFVNSVSYSLDGKQLASGSRDNTIKIWDLSTGKCLQTLEGHSNKITSVSYSPDGKQLASGSEDKTVKIWDIDTGKCLQTLEGHSSNVTSVSYSMDGKQLASGNWDGVRIWDLDTGACVQTLDGHSNIVSSVSYSLNGKQLTSGSSDKTVKFWDLAIGTCLQIPEGHSGSVTSVSYSSDGKQLALGSYDHTVKIWDLGTGKCIHTLEGHLSTVTSVSYSLDDKQLASGSYDHTVKIWDLNTGKCVQTLEGHSDRVNSVSYSPDGKQLASGSGDKTIKIWDLNTGKCLQTLEGHSSEVNSVSYNVDGKQLASGAHGTVKVWDLPTGKCLQTMDGHSHIVTSVSYSLNGKQLASGSWDDTVKIWDLDTGKCLQTLKGHLPRVNSVSYSLDGKQLASGSNDQTVKIWDLFTGTCTQTLAMKRAVQSVAWSNEQSVEKLAVGFGKSVSVFRIEQANKKLEAHMEWANIVEQILDFTKANLTGAQGLNSEQWELMRQLGAVGEPGEIREAIESPRITQREEERIELEIGQQEEPLGENLETEESQQEEGQIKTETVEETEATQQHKKPSRRVAAVKGWFKGLFKKAATELPT